MRRRTAEPRVAIDGLAESDRSCGGADMIDWPRFETAFVERHCEEMSIFVAFMTSNRNPQVFPCLEDQSS